MNEEVEGGKLEGSFQYELLLAIRDARKLYIQSRKYPELTPAYYDAVISICDMIMPFLSEEERMEIKPRKINVQNIREEELVKTQIFRRRLRIETHRIFRKTLELAKKRGLITVSGRGL